VTGVIPRHLFERGYAEISVADLRMVESMHDRKRLMYELSDGFVALPGALGTLDELVEVCTWAPHIDP
jgi:predicted Rossmann-fold nucleotide-binding protein